MRNRISAEDYIRSLEKLREAKRLNDSISIAVAYRMKRMRIMRGFERIMSIGNVDLKGLVVEESHSALIVTAKKKIYVPEKKIISL